MSTHIPWFKSFSAFLNHFVLTTLATSSLSFFCNSHSEQPKENPENLDETVSGKALIKYLNTTNIFPKKVFLLHNYSSFLSFCHKYHKQRKQCQKELKHGPAKYNQRQDLIKN